ncbi:Calcium-activated chloride channel regulator 3A-1 [Anabarilius grahami]|uniref:Calcium-activated chloride channel regulator 3A-1 n=1 Tax=Anabarilius grahami TaxID=495550 RepID=A0A3N0YCN0_ANAGA|nr:Calcium-activated chloride channel regulator 3A-1 [Anabarilius grahami]
MDSRTVLVLLWMLLSSSTGIKLDGNGYVDITIAISSNVPQDNTLIDKIKNMFTEGSIYLHQALEKKVYFKEATILVPPHWNGVKFDRASTESYEKAKIRIDNADSDEPYAHQYAECGDEAQYIHLTPNYLLNDSVIQLYGPRGKVLVHEWAHLRWGVYDEYSDTKPFYHSNGHLAATRCSNFINGEFHHVNADGSLQRCNIDPQTLLPIEGCKYFPYKNQYTDSSIMFMPSLDSVITFCQANEHNYEAPNLQNKKCGNKPTWSVIFEDSVDKDTLPSLKPMQSSPPAPIFKVVQREQRVICLILDVSGSMTTDSRILRLQQAATHLLRNIIEDQASVGIVSFSTDAKIESPLTTIDSGSTREELIKLLPSKASGSTNMCNGLNLGLQVLRTDDGVELGDEIIFLTDGEATDNIDNCSRHAIKTGAIIHTIAFGPNAANALRDMATQTGGIYFSPNDQITSNQLMDAFASLTLSTGDYTKDPVQLESVGKTTSDWFNGTVSVDQTVGNKTSFVIIYQQSYPIISIQSPSGSVYSQTKMSHDESLKTVTLNVPGTAEPGDWKYSIQTTISQSLTITVTSHAASADVPPIIVKARMSQQFSDGTKPMIVFAEVSQNYRPVINAKVWATLESQTGSAQELQLLDNGAGADAFKDDGVYSRYFTKLENGRISLKVRVKNQDGQARFIVQKKTGAPYVPGYVVNDGLLRNCGTGCRVDEAFTMDDLVDSISADTSGLRCGRVQLRIAFITPGRVVVVSWRRSLVSAGYGPETVDYGKPRDKQTHTAKGLYGGSTSDQRWKFQGSESVVELNPPKPPVSEEPLEVGSFTRTAIGESFEVAFTGSTPPNFPPNKITDLSAEIQEDSVLLSWTAPGEDLDQGTAKSYEIRWSYDLQMLRESFSSAHVVNTSTVSPQEAGSVEQHSFNLSFTIQNGTTLFFGVQSEDEQNAKSETSNIAQASKILPDPNPPGISNPGLNLTVLIISLCVVAMVICFVVAITTWAVRRRKRLG